MSARVLVVEDHPEHREYIVQLFQAFGCQATSVSSAEEAFHLARSQRPELILLDIMLRDGDGRTAARRLKETPETAHIPILAVTGLVLPRDREACLEAGCDGYLKKPFRPHEFRQEVCAVLARARTCRVESTAVSAPAVEGRRPATRRGFLASLLGS